MKYFISLLLFFTAANIQAQFKQPKPGLIYDDAEQLPQTGWGIDFTKGYAMVTGGNQSTTNVDARTGIKLSTQARKGSRSYELFVTKRTDKYGTCCEWTRSEVMFLSPSQQTSANAIEFAAVSIMIDPSMQWENRPMQIGFDSKASPDDLQTPFWLGILNGQYYVEGGFVPRTMLGPVVKGVWEDWLIHRNYSGGSDGFLRFYRNGKLVYSKSGPNWYTRSGDAPVSRYQHGLYAWVLSTENGQGWGAAQPAGADIPKRTIYIDEIRFGFRGGGLKLEDFLLDATTTPPVDPPPVDPPPTSGSVTIIAGSASDKYFTGGSTYSTNNQTERFGNFSYAIPVANGKYNVKLNFSEIYHTQSNQRIFNVLLEGKTVLSNYDIFVKAGASNRAVVEPFTVTITDGVINLQFVTVKDNAKLSAIEISPAVIEPPTVPDTNVYYVSSIESTETIVVNGITKTVNSTIITWSDGTKTEIYKK